MNNPVLHLASASPRRRDILTALGVNFSSAGVDIDECAHAGETPEQLVLRLAKEKAVASPAKLPVLGADTLVVCDDKILGKPATREDGLNMLALLSGRVHRVLTAVAIKTDRSLLSTTSATEVGFREISAEEARNYWRCGEPKGKAGGYAIQGRAGVFVASISGSYSGVVGLPVFETSELLRQIGIDVLQSFESG